VTEEPRPAIGTVNGHLTVKNEGSDPSALPLPVQIPSSEVHTICNYEGISVQVRQKLIRIALLQFYKMENFNNSIINLIIFPHLQIKHSEPFSGIVFVKNKYDTCRVEVEAKDSVTLVLGLPANFGMKPISLNPNPSSHGPKKPKAKADTTLDVEMGTEIFFLHSTIFLKLF
jgi:hypothetical protein